jgi:acetylornithine deacetylase/succinyl-diaminopimelate desuccinylase-like protein
MTDTGNDAVAFLRTLIRQGRDGEAAIQRTVALRLAALGCEVTRLDYDPATVILRDEFADGSARDSGPRAAIVGRLAGNGGGRGMIVFAHPDSEPLAGTAGWSVDPFAGTIVDGRLHGWGVADDVAGVAAMVSGLETALAGGWRPSGDIVIASTPSKRHARGVAAVLERIAPPDAAVYLHPAESGLGMAEIKACTPGLLEFRIAVSGVPPETAEIGHAAFAHRATSAIDAARPVLDRLATLDAERAARVRHARIEAAVGRATNVLVSSVMAGEPGRRNRVPVSCVIEGAISLPPGETLGAVEADVRAALSTLPSVTLAFPAGMAGAETAPGHPLFLAAAAAVRAETGREPAVNPLHGASDIRVPIVQRGIPTVGLGPLSGNLTQNGGVDEWVDAADHLRCVRVVARIMRDWCG